MRGCRNGEERQRINNRQIRKHIEGGGVKIDDFNLTRLKQYIMNGERVGITTVDKLMRKFFPEVKVNVVGVDVPKKDLK